MPPSARKDKRTLLEEEQPPPDAPEPSGGWKENTRLACHWEQQEWRACSIMENQIDEKTQKRRYYIHYDDYDRRLDEWVEKEQLRPRLPDEFSPDADNVEAGKRLKRVSRAEAQAESIHVNDEHAGLDEESIKEHHEATRIKNIERVVLGKYDISTWYFSPFPEEFRYCKKLWFCEWCLKCFRNNESLQRHNRKCTLKHPPGDEIYRKDNISVFEVDGKGENKQYCQNLSFLGKLFLDHKTLYYDVDPFLFYLVCHCDEHGCHLAAYFSKEKQSQDEYNLACILTLPPYQMKGFGKFMISFSYELSKKEGKPGSPEKPLSDMGYIAYSSYWKYSMLDLLAKHEGEISIKDISEWTCIKTEDVVITLQRMGLIRYWKGDHIVSITELDIKELETWREKQKNNKMLVDPSKLQWTPQIYVKTWF